MCDQCQQKDITNSIWQNHKHMDKLEREAEEHLFGSSQMSESIPSVDEWYSLEIKPPATYLAQLLLSLCTIVFGTSEIVAESSIAGKSVERSACWRKLRP